MTLVDLGIYAVDPVNAGTAFGNAIASSLSQKGVGASWGPRPGGIFQCTPQRDATIGTLVSVPMASSVHCFIAGDSAFAPDKAVPIWQEVIAYAVEAIRHRQKFYWSALIGPSPRSHGGNYTLAYDVSLGPVKLKAASMYMREWTHNPLSDSLGRSAWGSWPVVVTSSVLAFDSEGAREVALAQLNRICGLISVAWSCWWTVRQGPYAFDKPYEVSVYPYAFGEEASLFKDPTEPTKNYRSLPEWLDGAWRVLDKFPHLGGALGSFYESIQLSFHHPSFALVGFVAAIESVGAGPVSNSEGKIKTRPSKKGAFTAGLKAVAKTDVVRQLSDNFYGRRSVTAHTGVLHGFENRFGWPTNIYFGSDPSTLFMEDSSKIRTLSRIVLANAIMSQISTSED